MVWLRRGHRTFLANRLRRLAWGWFCWQTPLCSPSLARGSGCGDPTKTQSELLLSTESVLVFLLFFWGTSVPESIYKLKGCPRSLFQSLVADFLNYLKRHPTMNPDIVSLSPMASCISLRDAQLTRCVNTYSRSLASDRNEIISFAIIALDHLVVPGILVVATELLTR